MGDETLQRPAVGHTAGLGERGWHATPVEEVLRELRSTESGLVPTEAQRRLETVGPNTLPRAAGEGVLALVWRQVNTPLIYVLLASSVLALVMGKTIDGAVILGVVGLIALQPAQQTEALLQDSHRAAPSQDMVPGVWLDVRSPRRAERTRLAKARRKPRERAPVYRTLSCSRRCSSAWI